MNKNPIAQQRLVAQRILPSKKTSPLEVVSALGAMQSQDYSSAKWPIGLRSGCTEKEVIASINKGEIVRTWPMRGTLHFIAASDIHWMLDLLSFRALQGTARRMEFLGIDEKLITKCKKIAEKVLSGNICLTRDEFYEELEKNKIILPSQAKYHIIWRLAQDQLICFAKEKAGKPTLALLEEWIPHTKVIEGDEALRELATRYFTSHGPATLTDYQWWCGLTMKDARASIILAEDNLKEETINETTYYSSAKPNNIPSKIPLVNLGPFDEYIVGYKDRSAMIDPEHTRRVITINGLFAATVLEQGRVIGTYKKVTRKDGILLNFEPLTKFSATQSKSIEAQIKNYSKYLDKKVEVNI